MNLPVARCLAPLLVVLASLCAASPAWAQVYAYGALRPVIAAPVVAAPVAVAPAYVTNYTPAGNYAAVTAFAPPLVAEPSAIAVRTAYAPVVASPVAVTSYYAPAAVAPVAVAPTVAYYAPQVVASPVVAAPVVAAPVTAYYPGVLYRRGPLGVYRPVRSASFISY